MQLQRPAIYLQLCTYNNSFTAQKGQFSGIFLCAIVAEKRQFTLLQ